MPVPVEAARLEEPTDEEAWQAPPRLEWRPSRDEAPQAAAPRRDWRRIAAAASLASVVTIGGAAAAVHWRQAARAEMAETRTLVHRLDALSARFESLETNRIRDELASQRKLIAEIKAGAANARDVGGAVGQLGTRVDRLEKDQSAKLDKLAERMDHDVAARMADMTARLDKLETKVAVAAASSKPPLKPEFDKLAERIADMTARLDKLETKGTAVAASPKPPLKPETTKVEPTVSNETTGSIDKPRPRIPGFYVAEIHNGYAMIDGPAGEFAVAPGDFVPGGGRVIRIERHGRDWVVITTAGQIAAMND